MYVFPTKLQIWSCSNNLLRVQIEPIDIVGDLGKHSRSDRAAARAPGDHAAEGEVVPAGEGAARVTMTGGAAGGDGADHVVGNDGGVVAIDAESVGALEVADDAHVQLLEDIGRAAAGDGASPARDDGRSSLRDAVTLGRKYDGLGNTGKKRELHYNGRT